MNHFKRKLTAFTAMLAFLSLSQAATHAFTEGNIGADVAAHTGNTSIYTEAANGNAGHVDITSAVAGDVGQVDWRGFNVGANQSVNFGFSAQYQTILNRVLGGQASQIMGKLTSSCASGGDCTTMASTGKVVLINPAGIMFGAGSTVDINSFTASTFDLYGAKNMSGMTAAQLAAYEKGLYSNYAPLQGVISNGKVNFTSSDCNVKVNDVSYNYNNIKDMIISNNLGTENSGKLEVDMSKFYDFMKNPNTNSTTKAVLTRVSESAITNGASFLYFDSNYNQNNGTFTAPTAFNYRDPRTNQDINVNGNIVLDGTIMSNFNSQGKVVDGYNKAINLVGNNVVYRDSMLRTGQNYNYSGSQSFSGVKIITADGVQFGYLANGANFTDTIAADSKTNVSRSVDIDNANIKNKLNTDNLGLTGEEAANPVAIRSGKIDIWANANNRTGTNVKIKDTAIKGTKLIGGLGYSDGSVSIVASNDFDLTNSRITTVNTSGSRTSGNTTINENTYADKGGTVYVYAGKNANVDKSLVITSGNTGTVNEAEAGKIEINAGMLDENGSANITDSKLLADGYTRVLSNGEANVTNSMLQAYNTTDTVNRKNISVVGAKGVNLTDADLTATGHTTILGGREIVNETTGVVIGDRVTANVNIKATAPGKSIIDTEGNLIIHGTNTTIDNAALVYNKLDFANAAMRGVDSTGAKIDEGINNVTIKNDTTFTPTTFTANGSRAMTYDIDLTTNGDMTLDNASVKTASYNLKFNRVNMSDKTSDLVDDGSTGTIGRTDSNQLTSQTKVAYAVNTTPKKAIDVNIRSTKGNVEIKNGSDIEVYNNITVKADNGNITETASKLTTDSTGYNVSGLEGKIDFNAKNNVAITNSTNTANGNINIAATNGTYTQNNSTLEAKTNPIIADSGNVTIASGSNTTVNNNSKVKASKKVTITDGGVYTQDNSTVEAGTDAQITSTGNAILTSSTVDAQKNANLTTTNGNYTQTNSQVNAKDGNVTILANGTAAGIGSITITGSTSKVEAGNHVTITADKTNSITDATIKAGSDSTGYDADDAQDNIGDLTIASNNGSVKLKGNANTISEDANVNIIAKNNVAFGNGTNDDISQTVQITAKKDANITSTDNNITGEKTTMPTIKYGNELTFNAGKSNIFTSQDSLKSVNVNYNAGEANKFYTQKDIQFVNSSLNAPENFIESGKDVILNNLEIKQATALPENTKTEIYANGNVTTNNVTGEVLGAKDAGDYYTYPQSVSTDRTGTQGTTLAVNQTKLKVTTDTVKDPSNPDNGTITLSLSGANNDKAGVELTARNVDSLNQDPTTGNFKTGYYKTGTTKWDENIAVHEGPEIILNAVDNEIAIKELYSDKLTLDPNDKKLADTTGGTPVITVKDQGGLNLDPTLDYTGGTPDGFTYERNYNTKDRTVTGGDLTFGEWSEWRLIDSWEDPDGTVHNKYESTRDGSISDKITTQIDQAHTIKFDNNGDPTEFTLVYDKKSTTVEPGRDITAEAVRNDASIIPPPSVREDFIKTNIDDCPPEHQITGPTVTVPSIGQSLRTTLPRQQVEISKDSKVADNTADPTGNIMSAAAKVDLAQELNDSDLSSTVESNSSSKDSKFDDDDE